SRARDVMTSPPGAQILPIIRYAAQLAGLLDRLVLRPRGWSARGAAQDRRRADWKDGPSQRRGRFHRAAPWSSSALRSRDDGRGQGEGRELSHAAGFVAEGLGAR